MVGQIAEHMRMMTRDDDFLPCGLTTWDKLFAFAKVFVDANSP